MSAESVRTALKDLYGRWYRTGRCPSLSEKQKELRVKMAKQWIFDFKEIWGNSFWESVWMSDESWIVKISQIYNKK